MTQAADSYGIRCFYLITLYNCPEDPNYKSKYIFNLS